MGRSTKWFSLVPAGMCLLAVACASSVPVESAPAPATGTTSSAQGPSPWPVQTREHIDLWLHGFALLQEDTTLVPFFKRDYKDQIGLIKNRSNVLTQLDANRDQLKARFSENRHLVDAQFLAIYFTTWEQLRDAVSVFVQSGGNAQRGSDQQTQAMIATFAQIFPTAADRDWIRLFAMSLNDENDKFYRSYWQQQQTERAPILARVDSLWELGYRAKLSRYLNHAQLTAGHMVLSLPLDGEGRTVTASKQENTVVVAFPERLDAAADAIYVFAHEAIGQIAGQAIADNTTPAEKRNGVADRYASISAVRGGALLLAKVAPELADGYMRYYLTSARALASTAGGAGSANLADLFERTFPLSAALRDAIQRQIDLVLGGI